MKVWTCSYLAAFVTPPPCPFFPMSLGECIACQGGVVPILIYKANSGLGYVPTRQNGRVGGTVILMIQGSWSLGQFPRSPEVPPPACRNTLIVASR